MFAEHKIIGFALDKIVSIVVVNDIVHSFIYDHIFWVYHDFTGYGLVNKHFSHVEVLVITLEFFVDFLYGLDLDEANIIFWLFITLI
jgi:hypothetical protein